MASAPGTLAERVQSVFKLSFSRPRAAPSRRRQAFDLNATLRP